MTLLREPLCLHRGSLDNYLVVMISDKYGLVRVEGKIEEQEDLLLWPCMGLNKQYLIHICVSFCFT